LSQAERDEVMRFGDEFKQFIGRAKSEMAFVREAEKFAAAAGFKKWPGVPSKSDVRPGSRRYAINRDRTIVMFVIGTEPATSGARIVNAHKTRTSSSARIAT
jgi:aspartyl aminopeptidase